MKPKTISAPFSITSLGGQLAASALPTSFTVWTIPHTRAVTTLGDRQIGDRVNLECDLLGKYIERLLAEREGTPPTV